MLGVSVGLRTMNRINHQPEEESSYLFPSCTLQPAFTKSLPMEFYLIYPNDHMITFIGTEKTTKKLFLYSWKIVWEC